VTQLLRQAPLFPALRGLSGRFAPLGDQRADDV
jgi:hypothetical protein